MLISGLNPNIKHSNTPPQEPNVASSTLLEASKPAFAASPSRVNPKWNMEEGSHSSSPPPIPSRPTRPAHPSPNLRPQDLPPIPPRPTTTTRARSRSPGPGMSVNHCLLTPSAPYRRWNFRRPVYNPSHTTKTCTSVARRRSSSC
jgi:hypothetical protein